MREITEHWYLLIFAALLAILIAYASGWFLSRSTGIDGTTALFASVPGGAAEMTILGERFGAKVDRVALAQSLRIVLVVLIIPVGITLIGVRGVDIFQPPQMELEYPRLFLFLATASVGGWCLSRLRIPNAWMLGPLFVTVALSMAEAKISALPVPLSNFAQLLIGCSLGSRFEQQFLKMAPRFVSMVTQSVLFSILLSTFSAWSVAIAGEVAVPTMVLATAPGGIAEMCITAEIMQLGVPLITAAHVTRVVVLVTVMGPLFRFSQAIRLRR